MTVDDRWLARAFPRPALLRALGRASGLTVVVVYVVILGVQSLGAGGAAGLPRFGGDYPAFYAAGRAVLEGEGKRLHEPVVQRAQQARLRESGLEPGVFLPFAYPPWVALVYAPLAALPYAWSYAIHSFLMLLALGWACWTAHRLGLVSSLDPLTVTLGALCLVPVGVAVFGGQNAALSLALALASLWSAVRGRPLAAGVLTGLLLYKPHIAIAVGLALVVQHGWRVAWGWAAVAVALFTMSAGVAGWDWPVHWLPWMAAFRAEDAITNAANAASLPGVMEGYLHAGRGALGWAVAVGGTLAVVGFASTGQRSVASRAVLLISGVLTFSPHAMYYECTWLLAPLLWVAERRWGWALLLWFLIQGAALWGGLGALSGLLCCVLAWDSEAPRVAPRPGVELPSSTGA